MKNLINMLISALLLSGCASYIKHYSKTVYESGTTVETKTIVRPPANPDGTSSLSITNDLFTAILSPSQSKAEIDGARYRGLGLLLQYGFCGLLVLFGGWMVYSKRTSTKLGLITIGSGIVGFSAVTWVESSARVMSFVLPALIVFSVLYIAWRKFKPISPNG